MYKISQRRYLGNKNSILPFIDNIIKNEIGHFNSFCDIFSGTGVVGNYFNRKDNKVIFNDLLYHNFVSLNAFLNQDSFNQDKLIKIINDFNNLSIEKENYFSNNFGDKYFSKKNAIKIDFIREEIRNLFMEDKISLKEKFILITSLNYSIDRIANTVGHYDAYIKKDLKDLDFEMRMLDINIEENRNNEIHNQDANILIRDIECDAYHLLENLSLWQKPEVFGVAKKFDRNKIKSEYCKVNASILFDDLIQNAKCKYILLSYNNMGNNGNGRSNAKISDEQIIKSLSQRGKVKVFEQEHKEFNAGKEKRNDNIRMAS